jgi:hypothetical protein
MALATRTGLPSKAHPDGHAVPPVQEALRFHRPPAPWPRFGRLLHRLSHVRVLFYGLGLFFQARAMFFTTGSAWLDAFSSTLLMYGIAMSLEGLRDNGAMSNEKWHALLSKQKAAKWIIGFVFAGGLFSIAVGCSQFFLSASRDLAWGITTFGLGMISLGRQQYDLYAAVVSAAQLAAKTDTEPSRTPSVDRFLGSASASGSAPSES